MTDLIIGIGVEGLGGGAAGGAEDILIAEVAHGGRGAPVLEMEIVGWWSRAGLPSSLHNISLHGIILFLPPCHQHLHDHGDHLAGEGQGDGGALASLC